MIYVGIDPGVTGGVVALDEEGQYLDAFRTPSFKDKSKRQYDVRGMAESIQQLRTEGRLSVGIEKVGAMPRDGRVGAFSFGKGYGIWLGILAALEVPYIEVPPQRWQAKMLAGMARGPQVKVSAVARAVPEATDQGEG